MAQEIACECESDGMFALKIILGLSIVAAIILALVGAYVVILAIVFFDILIAAHNLTIYRERHKA